MYMCAASKLKARGFTAKEELIFHKLIAGWTLTFELLGIDKK